MKSILFALLLLPMSVMADCWPEVGPGNFLYPLGGYIDDAGKCQGTCITVGNVTAPVGIILNELETDYSSIRQFGSTWIDGPVYVSYRGGSICPDNAGARFYYSKGGFTYTLHVNNEADAFHAKKFFSMKAVNSAGYPSASLNIVGSFTPMHQELVVTGVNLAGSTTVNISGLGLTGVTKVRVNGTLQPITSRDPNRITVTPTVAKPWMYFSIETFTGQVVTYDLINEIIK